MTKFPLATVSAGGSPQQPLAKNGSGLDLGATRSLCPGTGNGGTSVSSNNCPRESSFESQELRYKTDTRNSGEAQLVRRIYAMAQSHKSQNQTIAQWLNVTRAGEQILCSIHPPVTFPRWVRRSIASPLEPSFLWRVRTSAALSQTVTPQKFADHFNVISKFLVGEPGGHVLCRGSGAMPKHSDGQRCFHRQREQSD